MEELLNYHHYPKFSFQGGWAVFTTPEVRATQIHRVTFERAFDHPPVVWLEIRQITREVDQDTTVEVTQVWADGFEYRIKTNPDSGSMTLHWVAFGADKLKKWTV